MSWDPGYCSSKSIQEEIMSVFTMKLVLQVLDPVRTSMQPLQDPLSPNSTTVGEWLFRWYVDAWLELWCCHKIKTEHCPLTAQCSHGGPPFLSPISPMTGEVVTLYKGDDASLPDCHWKKEKKIIIDLWSVVSFIDWWLLISISACWICLAVEKYLTKTVNHFTWW